VELGVVKETQVLQRGSFIEGDTCTRVGRNVSEGNTGTEEREGIVKETDITEREAVVKETQVLKWGKQ
jgi:hypothetical protein